jgi:pimeloyl-ACP methyl ester carboxylesterase
MAADVAALLDKLDAGSCDVAGISMGSCIAQELAISRPDLVNRLVLVAPWARSDPYTDGVLESLSEARAHGSQRQFNLLLRNTVWTPEWINDHSAEQELALRTAPALTVEAFQQQAAACASHDTRVRLSEVSAPTLITYGEQDVFIRPSRSREVAELIPGAELLAFQGSGHVHHWEHLDAFNAAIEEWLG